MEELNGQTKKQDALAQKLAARREKTASVNSWLKTKEGGKKKIIFLAAFSFLFGWFMKTVFKKEGYLK